MSAKGAKPPQRGGTSESHGDVRRPEGDHAHRKAAPGYPRRYPVGLGGGGGVLSPFRISESASIFSAEQVRASQLGTADIGSPRVQ